MRTHLSLVRPGGNARTAPLLPTPPKWVADAVCAQTDPDAFFPEKGGTTAPAKAICTGCTVRARCLDYALEHNERFGIWGGLSERERRGLRKEQRRAAA